MALTVFSNPSISGYVYADEELQLALTGSSSAIMWDGSLGGTFDNYMQEVPLMKPANRTGAQVITGRRANTLYQNWISNSNFSENSNYHSTLYKTGGVAYAWDTSILTPTNSGGGDVLFDFSTLENNLEKAGGLTDNGGDRNPTSATFRYCWHLTLTGLAYPRWKGVAQASPVKYKAFDRFRIQKIGNTVYYTLNGTVIATVVEVTGVGLYGFFTAYQHNATFIRPFFYLDNEATRGSLNINVYGVFPVQPNFNYEMNPDNVTLFSVAEDGTEIARLKGRVKQSLSLPFNFRPIAEALEIKEFWEYHQKHRSFLYRDLVFDKDYFMKFAAPPRFNPINHNIITMNVSLKEV